MFDNILIGADPEVFVVNPDNEFVSAGGMVSGTKDKPHFVDKGAVQVDGMALEFNIEPAKNVTEFVSNIETVYAQLREMIPPTLTFSDKCTAKFNEDSFKARPQEEKVLGCESDYNAYTGQRNDHPNQNRPMRTAGGHIHIGWRDPDYVDEEHEEQCRRVAKACDLFIGLPSVLFDDDAERRSMYGKAGAYRAKEYGVEYRTLSNAWLHDKKIQEFLYSNIEKMFESEEMWDYVQHRDVIDAINCSDKGLAKTLLEMYGVPYLEK
jgi:hypothetical protein